MNLTLDEVAATMPLTTKDYALTLDDVQAIREALRHRIMECDENLLRFTEPDSVMREISIERKAQCEVLLQKVR